MCYRLVSTIAFRIARNFLYAILESVKLWKSLVLINVAAVVGTLLAIFTVPGNTPLWIGAVCSVGTITVLNALFYRRLRRRKLD